MNYELRIKNKKGFSLIELIVVITIIALISVAGMVSYSGTNKKSRDARRVSDLEKMRIALEMIRQVGTTYPAGASSLVTGGYMSVLPKDPKTDNDYVYAQSSGGYAYSIGASMEGPPSIDYYVYSP